MHRISTALSMMAVSAVMAGLVLLPRGIDAAAATAALHKPDFSASRIDPMPVGTARQMVRAKRIRASRKA